MNNKQLKYLMMSLLCILTIEAVAIDNDNPTKPGSGYLKKSAAIFPSCLQYGAPGEWYNHTILTNPQGSFKLEQADSYGKVKSIISGNGKLDIGADSFGGDVSAHYLDSLDTSDRTMHIFYYATTTYTAEFDVDYKNFKSSINDMFYTENIKDMYRTATDGGIGFFALCGDEFVSRAQAAGTILVDIAITAKSNAEIESFGGSLTAGGKSDKVKVGISGALEKISNTANGNVDIKITAQQFGGKPEVLPFTLGKADSSGHYAVTRCGSAESSNGSCSNMLDGISNYVANDFAPQFYDSINGKQDLLKYYYTATDSTPYTVLFGPVGSQSTEAAERIVRKLKNSYDGMVRDKHIISAYKEQLTEYVENRGTTTIKIKGKDISKYILEGYLYGRDTLSSYSDIILQHIIDYYRPALETCLKVMDEKTCHNAEVSINGDKDNNGFIKNTKASTDFDASLVNSRGGELLERIKTENYQIKLLTVSDKNASKPKFLKTTCSLLPLFEQGDSSNSGLNCGDQGLSQEIEVTHDGEDNVYIPQFVYATTNGTKAYCIRYPDLTLTPTDVGVYSSVEVKNIQYKEIADVKDCDYFTDFETSDPIITKENILERKGTTNVQLFQTPLATLYPILGKL